MLTQCSLVDSQRTRATWYFCFLLWWCNVFVQDINAFLHSLVIFTAETKSDFVFYSVFWTLFCQTPCLHEIHFSAGFQAIRWLTKYSLPFRYYS